MTVRAYPAYKDSGAQWLGAIPAEWVVKRLKYVLREVDVRAGECNLDLLGLSKARGIVRRSDLLQGASASDDYSKYKVVHPGNLVVNKMQAWNGVFGLSDLQGIVSPDYSVFSFLDDEDQQIVCDILRTDQAAGELFTRCRGMGTAFLRINTGDFFDMRITLPPSNEKQGIAAFLDRETGKIDALVAEQERLIALLKEKRQAVISHAVTKGLNPNAPMKDSGVPWLGEVPEHWPVGRCSYYFGVLPGFAFASESFSQDDADTRLMRGTNVGVSAIRWDDVVYWRRTPNDNLDDYELFEGDLVLGMDRPWISAGVRVAKVTAADVPSLLLQRVARISALGQVSTDILELMLSSEFFISHFGPEMTGVSVPHISPDQIGDFKIPVPPESEQASIVAYTREIRQQSHRLVAEVTRAITLLRERRAALISAAVTGKIDVRSSVADTSSTQAAAE